MTENEPSSSTKLQSDLIGARVAELKTDGKDIRENYIPTFQPLPKQSPEQPSVYYPVMVPPMPISKFVDKIDWKSVNKVKKTKPEVKEYCESLKDNKDGFEAEVKVFRVLERMKQGEEIIVLHSLGYLHSDYQIFVGDHLYITGNKKGTPCDRDDDVKEGECDFVIMGKNYFVIIEVKKNKADLGYGKLQASRTEKLILGIAEMLGSVIPSVFKVVVAPTEYKDPYNDEKFRRWWKKNITDKASERMQCPETFEETKNVLLALRANKDNTWEKKRCSLGWNIRHIDEQLRNAIVTFEKKGERNFNSNPGVVEAPPNVKDFVGIKYLTAEQYNTLKLKEKLLFIHGPAGTGKTVIMCGKILELALSDKKNKIVVITFAGEGNNANLYETALGKAGVRYQTITGEFQDDWFTGVDETINAESRSKELYQVVIVNMELEPLSDFNFDHLKKKITNLVASQTDSSVFMDDMQVVFSYLDYHDYTTLELIGTLMKLSDEHHVWVACDMIQSLWCEYYHSFNDEYLGELALLSDEQRVSLSKNLRNTFDISTVLDVLRDLHTANSAAGANFCSKQEYGHFIHGPLIAIHFMEGFGYDSSNIMMKDLLINEFKMLLKTNDLDYTDIGIIYNDDYGFMVVQTAVETLRTEGYDTDKIILCKCCDCFSSEWPAVIAMLRLDGYTHHDLSLLYTAISRARVKCSVLILHHPLSSDEDSLDSTDSEYYNEVNADDNIYRLLEKLEPVARVIKHYVCFETPRWRLACAAIY
ncbi:uncharacterized protein LOC134823873 [Bolinopsis microptera]|uniref:uncharacterized protein LOC134823873 n=1 Tax=Bolinopsis microptera TaxID=2820187 RepID=UPI00307AC058